MIFKFKSSVCVVFIAALLLCASGAYADVCHVTTLSGGAVQGSLRSALANQPGAGGGNNCNVIDFAVAGVIELTAQIHINSLVTLDGGDKITLKPAASYTPVVAGGCLVRVINKRPNSGTETTTGVGDSKLLNIKVDAGSDTDVKYGVCLYSSGNSLTAVEVVNETVTSGAGILIKSSSNMLQNSLIYNNREGVIVDGGDDNLISQSNFWSNTGIGINLINGGNSNVLEPSNLIAIHSSADLKRYLIVGTMDGATNNISFFNVDADNKEGKQYLLNRSITNMKKATLGGETYFAVIIKNTSFNTSGDITVTTRDLDLNTSEFADGASLLTFDDIDTCISSQQELFNNYAADPTKNPCVDNCGYTTCGDIDNNPACVTEFDQCCATHPTDVACTGAPCPDADNDNICDANDNCPNKPNEGQLDIDGNGTGDICDATLVVDSCNIYYNVLAGSKINGQTPTEAQKSDAATLFGVCCGMSEHGNESICKAAQCLILGIFGSLLGDADEDGTFNSSDNCKNIANGPCAGVNNQLDFDSDKVGDVCDNCPTVANPIQTDTYGTVAGDVCEVDQDIDNDGVLNNVDNCPAIANADQADLEGNGIGDVCEEELDWDNDLVLNNSDNCPFTSNTNQADSNYNGIGDACDFDDDVDHDDYPTHSDGGTICNGSSVPPVLKNCIDNCPSVPNPDQHDMDGDGYGDACDSDIDGDGYNNFGDNCPVLVNPDQKDTDGDGVGDVCDPVPNGAIITVDIDYDGITNIIDNCIFVPNSKQVDADLNGIGDACEGFASDDIDADGIKNADDNCPVIKNPDQADANHNEIGDACEQLVYTGDLDGDLVPDWEDNCVTIKNPDQFDSNDDGIGDTCQGVDISVFYDIDGDGVSNVLINITIDNCPFIWNPLQKDSNNNGIGDACDINSMFVPPDDDLDGDGVRNAVDNCPAIRNPDQKDSDSNGVGDACQFVFISDGGGVEPAANLAASPVTPGATAADDIDIGGNGGASGCSLAGHVSSASTAGGIVMLVAMVATLSGIRIRKRNDI